MYQHRGERYFWFESDKGPTDIPAMGDASRDCKQCHLRVPCK